ncbi:MAG: 4Fe-4S binding protein [Dehalococcoidia bacterium]
MESEELYKQLAEMINRDDPHILGMPQTPAFIKLLSLQFTPEEAKLALEVGLTGGTLDELAQKTGRERETLKKMMHTMANKGTMWIDPGKEDPKYRVLGSCAPGLVETGLFGNIRFPYDVELGKTLHQVVYEWARDKLCKLGFPFAPVWAHPWVLPGDAKPEESLVDFLKGQNYFSVSTCPCRLSHWLVEPENHCDHMLETCLHSGDTGRWCVEHGMGREITLDEALELLRKTNAEGLVHTINIEGFICNCCTDCCPLFIGFHKLNTKTMIPSPFIPVIDEGECTACGSCIDLCPVNALKLEDIAEVDIDTCIGCGVCVTHCDMNAIKLARRSQQVEIPADVKDHIG